MAATVNPADLKKRDNPFWVQVHQGNSPYGSEFIIRSDNGILYNQIANLRLTSNGHSYCPGTIEMVRMVHYRNWSESREWLFSETDDVMFRLHPDNGHANSSDNYVERLSLTSE